MDRRKRWVAFKGRLFTLVGVTALFTAMFLPNEIPEPLNPLIVVFGVGFILLAIPKRVWIKFPEWFRKDDTWV